MAASLEARVQDLERRLRTLETLVAQLNERLNSRVDLPVDERAVQKKTRFDWQS
jgi:hypothetical protein